MGSYVSPNGRRIVKTGSGRTKSEAKAKLKEVLRDYEDGAAIAPSEYTGYRKNIARALTAATPDMLIADRGKPEGAQVPLGSRPTRQALAVHQAGAMSTKRL